AARDESFALGIRRTLELVDRDAVLRGEAVQRGGRYAVRVEADVQVRTQHHGRLRGLLRGDRRHQHGEAARRAERLRVGAVGAYAAPREALDDAVRKRRGEVVECLRRQLFGAEFDEEGG